MTEREAYLQQMEAEKRGIDARIAEVEAQEDIRKADDEAQALSGAKRRREEFRRKLEVLRQRGTENFDAGKAELRRAYDDANQSVAEAEERAGVRRADYERKREAELRELGAQFDGWQASVSRSRADDSILTRQELDFVRQSFKSTGDCLRRLMTAKGADWSRLRKEYDGAWDELVGKYREVRSSGGSGVAEQPPSPS
ncbi:hypothetical protein LZ198_14025 [Myxococcus sp. K15C18031901]|uniref:hypothetical protein n=1 Tax=Myxococcus dinghuensis TaxID=2906761 RepID=UPI0020A798BC|nr:hypothetical protein [Myxococcus dinghuensis]MCP3099989.1 hypothetical protein [Myxococcus dinghuensis]